MTRVSRHYRLGRTQASLEFVDVDIRNDTPLFIDPGSILYLNTSMAQECASLVQSFFGHVIDLVKAGNHAEAQALLATLSEPNETRLGMTDGRSGGHGMGEGLAESLWDALSNSAAARSGLLQDLEDTALFVDGIDRDIISDIVTNIIRSELIGFTHAMAARYGIAMKPGIVMPVWDRQYKAWVEMQVDLPVADNRPLLLVPRNFVRRRRGTFSADKYYTHHVLPYLQQQHLNANSNLVRVLRHNVKRPPFKKTLKVLHPDVKATNVAQTIDHRVLRREYRAKAEETFEVATHSDLAKATSSPPDWDGLLAAVLAIPPGNEHAHAYHMAVEALLTACLYPALDSPKIEAEIHEGRKRIDISYTNIARDGFFYWLHATHQTPCSFVAVECKNYSREVNNPEFDQLSGRFGIQRGKIGFLCYRGYADKAKVIQRCRDTAADGRGYIIALDDEDLRKLVEERKALQDGEEFTYFYDRFRELI